MKVLLRADASPIQGTGHVMRCLTLAESLVARGHDVELMSSTSGVDWLERAIADSGLRRHSCDADALDVAFVEAGDFDWVVVDSYRIPAAHISALTTFVRCLAIVDGDIRGIDADLFLDQNIGAEHLDSYDGLADRLLAGSSYSLVRSAFTSRRRHDAWRIDGPHPRVVAFMGGSDPSRSSVEVARVLVGRGLDLTVVTPATQFDEVAGILSDDPLARAIGSTIDLPAVLAASDIVVSAAGTSSWDVCTLGIPSVLVGVVDNQKRSVEQANMYGVALGLDVTPDTGHTIDQVGDLVMSLSRNEDARRLLVENCGREFDGRGGPRIVEALESRGRA